MNVTPAFEAKTAPPRSEPVPVPRQDACEEFIRTVYHDHGKVLMLFAARLLGGDWHLAEDLLQEAVTRAWKHFAGNDTEVDGRVSGATLRPWLFVVIRNLAIDHHRARGHRPREASSVDDMELPTSDSVDGILATKAVLDALQAITPIRREIIVLTYYHGYSIRQAAEHLGIPEGTVKSRAYYALRALKAVLGAQGILADD